MNFNNLGLFDLAAERLNWAGKRQALLAQNIANASTPGYRPMDERSFASTLTAQGNIHLVRTAANQMPGTSGSRDFGPSSTNVGPRTADNNGVGLEEQLMKVADTTLMNTTITAILKKYIAMFNTALGKTS